MGHAEGKKVGFGVPLDGLLQGALLTRVEQKLRANPMLRAWLKPGAVAAVTDLQRRGGGASGLLVQLLQVAAWYRIFLVGPVRRPAVDDDFLDWI